MADTLERALPGLSETEAKQFEKLRAKANAAAGVHAAEIRVGEAYIALTNLSVPRRGPVPKDEVRQSDLVPAGETVWLTDEEAATFLRHDGKDGRRIPVIRKLHGPDSSAEPNAGRIHPSYLSGPVFRPSAPPPGTDLPRPDLPDSSRIISSGPPVPEGLPPQVLGSMPPAQDAVDIVPGTGQLARDAITAGANPELVAAAKAQAGMDLPAGPARRGTPNDGRR
jgi:hypothetical protein